MKNKKGFVFIETLIVVAILTVSLLMLYGTYSAVIRKEKKRISYNDSTYLYRTFYIENFFRNFNLENIVTNTKILNKDQKYITAINCNDIFIYDSLNKGFCETLVNDFHVRTIFLTFNDLSPLQNCTNASGICESLNSLGDRFGGTAEYIKTLGKASTEGYRVIIEYSEKKDGSYCADSDSDCKYYYATISLKEN